MSLQSALHRYGGMYGSAFRNGQQLADVVEVTGNIEVNRIEVPLVGTTKQGYKAGRESREGTIRIQKIDAYWEEELLAWIAGRNSTDRDTQVASSQAHIFDLKLQIDDPEALGREAWQLTGCQLWRIPLGFSITDDIIDREFPFTWEYETLIESPDTGAAPAGTDRPAPTT